MWGQGLIKGLGVTIKHHFGHKITRQYPEVRPDLPARSRGSLGYDIEKCIACGICTQVCPNRVVAVEAGRGADGKKRAKSFVIDLQYCLFCGLCVENCPKNCLYFTPNFELACFNRKQARLIFTADLPAAPEGAKVPAGEDQAGSEADEALQKKQDTMKKLATQVAQLKKEAKDPELSEEEKATRLAKAEKISATIAKLSEEIKAMKQAVAEGGGDGDNIG